MFCALRMARTIVLQFNAIENELYILLEHIHSIIVLAMIDMVAIDDKTRSYRQQERCNLFLRVVIVTISCMSVDIKCIPINYRSNINHQSLRYQQPITNPLASSQLHLNFLSTFLLPPLNKTATTKDFGMLFSTWDLTAVYCCLDVCLHIIDYL